MVVWTPERDQQLLVGIFEFMDIKNSKELQEFLAAKIGDGCTPKAVSHRLNNMKGKGTARGTKSATPSPAISRRKNSAVTTPKSRGSARRKKSDVNYNEDSDPQDDSEPMQSPSNGVGKKRGRQLKIEDDLHEEVEEEKGGVKKIKTEEHGREFAGAGSEEQDGAESAPDADFN